MKKKNTNLTLFYKEQDTWKREDPENCRSEAKYRQNATTSRKEIRTVISRSSKYIFPFGKYSLIFTGFDNQLVLNINVMYIKNPLNRRSHMESSLQEGNFPTAREVYGR